MLFLPSLFDAPGSIQKCIGVFKLFLDKVEELSRLGAIDDFVIDRQGQGHQFAYKQIAVRRHYRIDNGSDTENARLARHYDGDERFNTEPAEIADGDAAAFQVVQ